MRSASRVTRLGLIAAILVPLSGASALAQIQPKPIVRIAELEIDPAQLDSYRAFLTEEVETSVRVEPGVLMLNAVAVREKPTSIRLMEVYADQAAYEAHLRSPHFLKYKNGTAHMVRSLKLIETDPIKLCAKAANASSCR